MQVTEPATIAWQQRAGRRSLGAVALACFLAVLALTGCGESESYRYRMTVYVDTPTGSRSGSSVIEVVTSPNLPGGNPANSEVRGEAVAVDLPGGPLFALLSSPTNPSAAETYAAYAYAAAGPIGHDWRTVAETIKRQTAPAVLPAEYLPRLVRFRDPADARTIEVVDPRDLAAGFGSGFRLNRVVIQSTEEPVTSTIETRLPSFRAGSGFAEWIRSLDVNDPRRLSSQDFRRGF